MKRLFNLLLDLITFPYEWYKRRQRIKKWHQFDHMWSKMNRVQRRKLLRDSGMGPSRAQKRRRNKA